MWGVCSFFRSESSFVVQKARKGRATVRIRSGRDLSKIVVTVESIPQLLFAGRDSDSSR